MVHVVSCQAASRIGQHFIRNPLAGWELGCMVGGCLACREYQLRCLDDIADFFTYMGFPGNVVDIGHQGCLGCNDLGYSGLTSGVGMAVVMCEHQGQITSVTGNTFMVAAAHEYPVIGHEAVIEYGQAFHIPDIGIGRVQMGTLMVQPGKGHQLDAVPVSRKREGHRIITVILAHELGWVNNDFIHVRSAGVADLGAADKDALTWFSVHTHAVHICIYHVYKGIRVRLHVGAFVFGVAGTFYIGLRAVAD